MRTQLHTKAYRLANFLFLFILIFTPAAGIPVNGTPSAQETEPNNPVAAGDHLVTNISLSLDTPNILFISPSFGVSMINLTFNYSTTESGGVRIFARPFTDGALSPHYAAHNSPLYPASATGSGSGWFYISSGTTVVDQIRIQMWNNNQTTLLFETFIPVYYLFSDIPNIVTNISLTPDTPDVLKFSQNVNLAFDYYAPGQADGVEIVARPFTNGKLTHHYDGYSSPVYPSGSGKGTDYFTITFGQVVVDQIRIQMLGGSNHNTLLFEAFLPVYYRFRDSSNIVTNIEFNLDTPNIFKYEQYVNLTFNYTTDQSPEVYIGVQPFSGANSPPNYPEQLLLPYPTGSGIGSGYFSLSAGPLVVDKVRIQMWDFNQTTLLFEAFLPVHLFWAGAGPPPGPNMSVDAIEVTQAIQDLNNSVDLVAGKQTFVRVHVHSPVDEPNVFATLSGKHGLVSLNPILNPGNPGSTITVRTSPDRGQLNDSFWFELPSGWTTAGNLTLTARLDPNNAKNDLNQTNNTRMVTVNFKDTPPLRLHLVNVQYTSDGHTYLAASSHLAALESWLQRAYPISSLEISHGTLIYPTSGLPNVNTLHGWLALAKLVSIIFSGEDSRVVYYGMVDDGGGFMRGKAAGIPSTIAAGPTGTSSWGWDFDGSYGDWYGGHEIGHTRGRHHANYCGAGGGIPYPYTGGRISPDLTGNGAIYGFDITTHAIYPPTWKDLMTYCDNEWPSDFTYEGIRDYLVGIELASLKPAMVTASQFLAVVGIADMETYSATLEDVYLISQDNTLPLPDPGDWSIALMNASDNDLATYPFSPRELTDTFEGEGHPAVIGEVVPWTAGTVKIEIRYKGQVVATRAASAHPPTVDLTAPTAGPISTGLFQVSWTGSDPDGDALTYSLLYSNDGGFDWQTLATNLTGSGLQLNTNQLPGGSGLLRIIASDGFLTGQDTSPPLGMPLHAPSAQILTPNEGQVFYPTQQVFLQGSAYDLEDGTLDDSAFQWTSSLDGFLGDWASLNTAELTTGTHLITMTVTDSDGMSALVQRSITIAEEGTPLALTLDVAPFGVGVVVAFGDSSLPYNLTLRSVGETELDWTATKDAPWLSLSATSGTTPSDLVLTIDPSHLPVGIYYGKVTFSSPEAGNSPVDVAITLQVTGKALFLPLITRIK